MNYKQTQPQWPISEEELKARYKACAKEENLVSGIWLVLFFAFLFACIALSKQVESLAQGVQTGLIILFFAVLVGNLYFMFKTMGRRIRDYGLACPECGKLFTGKTMGHILKTGHCDKCNREILKKGDQSEV